MAICPTCKRTYADDRARCPVDSTPLRSGVVAVEPTQSLAVEPPGGPPRTEDISMYSNPARPTDATSVESPTALDKLASGSRPEEMTSDERPGKPRRRRSSTMTPPAERSGRVLGNYRLVELIGRGGMGFVYHAVHVKLGRPVALKLLRSSHAERRDAVARFFQEARAVNRIRHRNIVDVTDFVELDDGTTFIIMELLEGASLRTLMRKGPIAQPRVLAMMIQICEGLAAAHDVGIVHRDLKPDNVFIVPQGEGGDLVKLLDFGVAKLLRHDDDSSFAFETAAGAVIGTPAYMSPEQAGGLDVDGRSDIYSLGAIMYELLVGQPPFRGKSFGEYVRKHLSAVPVPPRQTQTGEDIDPQLEALVMRCLEKRPDDRYTGVNELRTSLVGLLSAAETSISLISDSDILAARTALGHDSRGLTAMPHTAMAVGDVTADGETLAGGSRWPVALGLAAVAAIAAVAIVFVVSRSGSSVAGTEPATTPLSKGQVEASGRQPAPEPTVEPVPPPRRDVAPNFITVRFESRPSAAVYRAGEATAICPTPCNVTINTLDGGNQVSRNFVLRAPDYEDEPVTVSLRAPKSPRRFRLTHVRDRAGRRTWTPPRRRTRPTVSDKERDTGKPTTVKPKRTSTKPKGDGKREPTVDPTTTIDPFSPK